MRDTFEQLLAFEMCAVRNPPLSLFSCFPFFCWGGGGGGGGLGLW